MTPVDSIIKVCRTVIIMFLYTCPAIMLDIDY